MKTIPFFSYCRRPNFCWLVDMEKPTCVASVLQIDQRGIKAAQQTANLYSKAAAHHCLHEW